jgi:hypothetical protein
MMAIAVSLRSPFLFHRLRYLPHSLTYPIQPMEPPRVNRLS